MPEPAEILNAPILVVDDEAMNVELMKVILRVAGFTRVDSTTDPVVVCDLHRANHYDLILLDQQMPRMDGIEVLKALVQENGQDHLSVIVMSADPAYRPLALKAGARDFVEKPFRVNDIRARVHAIIGRSLLSRQGVLSAGSG